VVAANPRLRVSRPVGNSRKRRPDCLELRPLLVIQLAVEVVEGCTYRLDRLQHGIEPVGDSLEPRTGGVIGSVGRAGVLDQVRRLCVGLLERLKVGPVARRSDEALPRSRLSASRSMPDCAVPQLWASDPFVFRAASRWP